MSLPKTYRKLIATKLTTDFDASAKIIEVPLEMPGAGEVLVKTKYAGVNASDINMTAGRYNPGTPPPFDLGMEALAEVVAVGEGVTNLKVGMNVATPTIGGGYREYNKLKAKYAIPLPMATPAVLSIIVSGLTASVGLDVAGRMGTDETVMVTAAAGGTGQYAVQLAKMAGNHVIGTCSTEEKAEMLREMGCDRVILYKEENVAKVLKAEYPKGIDVIYESVGGKMFDACLKNLAIYGRLICIGFMSEYKNGVEAVEQPRIYAHLLGKSATVAGFFLPQYSREFPKHMEKLMTLYAQGKLKAEVDPTEFIGLEGVNAAVAHLQSGKSRGKVVVKF